MSINFLFPFYFYLRFVTGKKMEKGVWQWRYLSLHNISKGKFCSFCSFCRWRGHTRCVRCVVCLRISVVRPCVRNGPLRSSGAPPASLADCLRWALSRARHARPFAHRVSRPRPRNSWSRPFVPQTNIITQKHHQNQIPNKHDYNPCKRTGRYGTDCSAGPDRYPENGPATSSDRAKQYSCNTKQLQ